MLTCFNIGSACTDRAVARYYRYDVYGKTTAYDSTGSTTSITTPL